MKEPIDILRAHLKEINQSIKLSKDALNYNDTKELERISEQYTAAINLLSYHYDESVFLIKKKYAPIKSHNKDSINFERRFLHKEKRKLVAERNIITSKISIRTARIRRLKSYLN